MGLRVLPTLLCALLAALLVAPVHADEAPLLRVVVMRHSVRSPTKPPEALAAYADQPWARWPVAPGMLTPHGVEVMRQIGAWWAREANLGPGCKAAPTLLVIADSTPRNHESAAALLDGLLPDCVQARYFALPSGQHDPLFQGLKEGDDDGAPPSGKTPAANLPRERLAELQAVLTGGSDADSLARARAAGKKLLLDMADPTKPMGTLSENLMLEYAEGMARPAWGRTDAAGIARLIELHNAAFARSWVGNPAASRARASDLLARIAATLGVGSLKSLAGPDQRLVFLVAHDSNLAALAGLLGLDWHGAQPGDDYPPGGALVFDRLKGGAVRVSTVMPALDALRHADFVQDGAMLRRVLRLPACAAEPCSLARFGAIVNEVTDPQAVAPADATRSQLAARGQ